MLSRREVLKGAAAVATVAGPMVALATAKTREERILENDYFSTTDILHALDKVDAQFCMHRLREHSEAYLWSVNHGKSAHRAGRADTYKDCIRQIHKAAMEIDSEYRAYMRTDALP